MKTLFILASAMVGLFLAAPNVEAQRRKPAIPAESTVNTYLRYRVTAEAGGDLLLTGFRKTNGYEQAYGIYVIEWQAEILFEQAGYKAGDAFVGYWRDFRVLKQQPSTLDSLVVGNTIHFNKGTTVRLTGTATLRNTEKGWRLEGFEVKTSHVLAQPIDRLTLRYYLVLHVINGGYDEQGKEIEDKPTDAVVDQTIEIIRKRLRMFGLASYSVERGKDLDGSNKSIHIKLPSMEDPELVKSTIATEGRLEIVHLISPPAPKPPQIYPTYKEAIRSVGGEIPSNRRILPDLGNKIVVTDSTKWIIVDSQPIIETKDLLKCQAIPPSGQNEDFRVSCSLKNASENKFYEWMGANINQYAAVVLNGNVNSIANIKSKVSGSVTIYGKFSKSHAEAISIALMSGALPTKHQLVFMEERLISERDSK
jgi:preprotein translocase subunit SecD